MKRECFDTEVRRALPVVLVSCSFKSLEIPSFGVLKYQAVYERYVDALVEAFECAPVLVPALGDLPARVAQYVDLADGLFLTGAISNVGPQHYGGPPEEDPGKRDEARDATILPLIRQAIARDLPVMGICRGMQEINVALGGSLHQRVHELPGRRDHRSDKSLAFPDRYLPAHTVKPTPGGWLEQVVLSHGLAPADLRVNSLHAQAVDRLGDGVTVEATADDGTVEALRVGHAAALAFGLQWHVEWYASVTPLHAALFAEFAAACRARRHRRQAMGATAA